MSPLQNVLFTFFVALHFATAAFAQSEEGTVAVPADQLSTVIPSDEKDSIEDDEDIEQQGVEPAPASTTHFVEPVHGESRAQLNYGFFFTGQNVGTSVSVNPNFAVDASWRWGTSRAAFHPQELSFGGAFKDATLRVRYVSGFYYAALGASYRKDAIRTVESIGRIATCTQFCLEGEEKIYTSKSYDSVGFEGAIGNEWITARGFVIGIEWMRIYVPAKVLSAKTTERVDAKKEARAPQFNFLNMNVGYALFY